MVLEVQHVAIEASDHHPATVYLARLAPGSRRTQRAALRVVASILSSGACDMHTFPWARLQYQHTAALRAALIDRCAPATVNRILSALRGVLKEAWRLGQMTAENYQRTADVQNVTSTTLLRGRALSAGELAALMQSCADGSISGIRDAALLGVLYSAGLRRAELVSLSLSDCDLATGTITVRQGKGRKDRLCYLASGAVAAVEDWLRERGQQAGPLFMPVNRGEHVQHRALSEQAVYGIILRRGVSASVRHFSPHDLRRSYVSDLLDADVDLSTVQQLAGHASPKTTARYDRRGERVKKKATELLHVPYVQRVSGR